jgi:Mn-dependent DtxR family transcriptional regulator
MAMQTYLHRISLRAGHAASHEEITRVWKLISAKPTISTRKIAAHMGTSTTRVHHMIAHLKKMGLIACSPAKRAWDVLISYVEVQK